jgi:alpha-galactosidase
MLLFAALASASAGSYNGLGLTPALGWNSWNQFGCDISQDLIKKQAQAMVDTGLQKLGFTYVVIDDCWQAKDRDASGQLQADPDRFPDGIPALADFVHNLSLKLGIYSDVGTNTCQGFPGSSGNYAVDAQTFADWKIDFLKFDTCHLTKAQSKDPAPFYKNMSEALLATNHDIFYSICNWGMHNSPTWAHTIANQWRTTQDIYPNWHRSMVILDAQVGLAQYAGPGGFNDPDMIEVGVDGTVFNKAGLPKTNLTQRESKAHYSLWSMLSAPLILGVDLTTAPKWAMDIISNANIIGINQDPTGMQAAMVQNVQTGTWVGDECVSGPCSRTQVWAKELELHSNLTVHMAILFLNRADPLSQYSSHFKAENVSTSWKGLNLTGAPLAVYDVWTGEDKGVHAGEPCDRSDKGVHAGEPCDRSAVL